MARRKSRTVLVGGGGITGLTAALALSRRGFRVELFEQAEGFETIGAGLQISPNALAVLDRLDLAHRVKAVAASPTALRVMSAKSGREIVAIPLGSHATERYGRPYLVAHRADLQQVLASACADDPDIELNMASRLEDAAVHSNGVTALVGREAEMQEYSGFALVAADGVRSRLRKALFTDKPAAYSGLTAWRALISAEKLTGSQGVEATQLWLAPKAHAVTYPVRSGRYLNVVVMLPAKLDDEGGAAKGDAAHLKEALKNWSPAFTELLDQPARWTCWPLYSAPRLAHWAEGPVALAGDAAHGMLPFAAQGAAMGIEDAVVLADCLKLAKDKDTGAAEGLGRYEKLRRARVARARRMAVANGFIYHLPPVISLARNIGMKVIGGSRLLTRQDWLYGWRPENP